MSGFAAIADDLTGACDVAAELAAAGQRARVLVAPGVGDGGLGHGLEGDDGAITIVNTQSRALAPAAAAARVRAALGTRSASLVVKKIDTALRGHLGAELDAALEVVGGPGFVVAAIPAAGRVTRDGCQWFGGRLLADTEFARDPEGPGAVSSIPDVLARECGRRTAVIGRTIVQCGQLADAVARRRRDGVDVFVVDAESDDDVDAAVAAILALPRPLCLAGSIALAAAVVRIAPPAPAASPGMPAVVPPMLVVNGSLHSRARAQVAAVLATGRALEVVLPTQNGGDDIGAAATAAGEALARGGSVVLVPEPASAVPSAAALRATERVLAETVVAIAARVTLTALVLIGGETSYAILRALHANTIAVRGRIAPLVACGTILDGAAAGAALVTKGGSGGASDVIAALFGAIPEPAAERRA